MPPARSRAASAAHRVELDAEFWMTPLPRYCSGSPRADTSQSSMCCSNSATAGLVSHSRPTTPSPDDTRSPSAAGPLMLAGK